MQGPLPPGWPWCCCVGWESAGHGAHRLLHRHTTITKGWVPQADPLPTCGDQNESVSPCPLSLCEEAGLRDSCPPPWSSLRSAAGEVFPQSFLQVNISLPFFANFWQIPAFFPAKLPWESQVFSSLVTSQCPTISGARWTFTSWPWNGKSN